MSESGAMGVEDSAGVNKQGRGRMARRSSPRDTGVAGEVATVRDVLVETLAILREPADWAPGRIARRADGTVTTTNDMACTQRSLPGALCCAIAYYGNRTRFGTHDRAGALLTAAAGQRYDYFDEAPETTFADVRRVVETAIKAAG